MSSSVSSRPVLFHYFKKLNILRQKRRVGVFVTPVTDVVNIISVGSDSVSAGLGKKYKKSCPLSYADNLIFSSLQ